MPHGVRFETRCGDQVVEERRPALHQHVQHLARGVRNIQVTIARVIVLPQALPALAVFAQKERHRCRAYEPRLVQRIRRRAREARPSHLAGETEHVEQLRIVPVDARGKNRTLPG